MREDLMVTKRVFKDDYARWCPGFVKAGLVLLALTLALMLALASVALAAPKGIFAVFAQCPTSAPATALCQHAELTSGVFDIGKVNIPITRPIIIQGGEVSTGGANLNEYFLSPAANGQTISSNELEIPGGLRTILPCPPAGCRGPSGGIVSNAVSATLETAASPANPGILNLAAAIEEHGAAFTYPLRLQLHNSLLGNACYIGSPARPIELHLTAGITSPPPPNKPISGSLGRFFGLVENGDELTAFAGGKLVDNSFSVPAAQGCGEQLAGLIDPEIDHVLGLESSPGHNMTILTSSFQLAEVSAVLASASFPGR